MCIVFYDYVWVDVVDMWVADKDQNDTIWSLRHYLRIVDKLKNDKMLSLKVANTAAAIDIADARA